MSRCAQEWDRGQLILKRASQTNHSSEELVRKFETDEGLQLLTEGEWVLHEQQTQPPFQVLELLEERVKNTALFGRCLTGHPAMNKLASDVFAGGVRQSFVDGHTLAWMDGERQLRRSAERVLSHCSVAERNLFDQAKRVRQASLEKRGQIEKRHGAVSRDVADELCLIPARQSNFLDRTRSYYRVPEEWYLFAKQVSELRKMLRRALHSAMSEGRIFCCEETGGRARFCPPDLAADRFLSNRSWEGCSFCYSRDLPTAWFTGVQDLPKRRKEAYDWMLRCYVHFRDQGRRAAMETLVEVMMEKFKLTKNAAEEVRAEVSKQVKPQPGRIPDSKKVDSAAIVAFE